MTPEEEEEIVRAYCHKRPLVRPDTRWWDLVLFVLIRGLLAAQAGLVIWYIWRRFWGPFLLAWILLLLLNLKKAMVLSIEVYQHYAPEQIRRRCLCMPTCSEYAIACLQKYNLFSAVRKIYIRLVKTCRGTAYHIDEP